jgi:hypothetical protein
MMEGPPRHVVEAATGPLRGVVIDPERRLVHAVPVPAALKPCGCCWEASPHAVGEMIGSRWLQAFGILDCQPHRGGETLIVSASRRGRRWRWGSTELWGTGLILRLAGAPGAWMLDEATVSVPQVLECVSWGSARRTRRNHGTAAT